MNFELNFGKATLQKKGSGKGTTAAANNRELTAKYEGKSVIQVPAKPGKGEGARFTLSQPMVDGLNIDLSVDSYLGMQGNPDKQIFLLNVTGVIAEEETKGNYKFAKVTKGGTFSSAYFMGMIQKAFGLEENKSFDLEVAILDAGNVTGACEIKNNVLASELSELSEGSDNTANVETVENTAEQGNDTQQEVAEETTSDAVEENGADEDYW